MIDPRTVLVCIPCADGRVMSETMEGMLQSTGLYGAWWNPKECSLVPLVRNMIAQKFLSTTQFEWLVCIDSDIGFTRADFMTLLDPFIPAQEPEPTHFLKTVAGQTHSGVLREDGSHELVRTDMEVPFDLLVCAEYPYKKDGGGATRLGLGFTRIHRSVFERLIDLKHDDTGSPRLWNYMQGGVLCWDFYPVGALISQMIPQPKWLGEDHGFFMLCRLAGIVPRIERRTRLVHLGRKGYVYESPEEGAQ